MHQNTLNVFDQIILPCITSDLKKRKHDRDIAKLKAMRSKNSLDWADFKRLRNRVNSEIKLAKARYYKDSFDEYQGDSRRTWKTVNELISRKSNKLSVKELVIDGVSITNSPDLSDAFNEHFSTVGPKLADEIPLLNNQNNNHLEYLSATDKRFQFSAINSNQVLSLLNKLSKSKATGA